MNGEVTVDVLYPIDCQKRPGLATHPSPEHSFAASPLLHIGKGDIGEIGDLWVRSTHKSPISPFVPRPLGAGLGVGT
jgi:hypothetical protein